MRHPSLERHPSPCLGGAAEPSEQNLSVFQGFQVLLQLRPRTVPRGAGGVRDDAEHLLRRWVDGCADGGVGVDGCADGGVGSIEGETKEGSTGGWVGG